MKRKKSRAEIVKKLRKEIDILHSPLIRARDAGKPCIDLCGNKGTHQAGHFRRRECMATRWHPHNVNGQNEWCNCWGNDTFRHGKGIDERWGKGTADYLEHLASTNKNWEIKDLETLKEALKKGYEEYEKVYFKLTEAL